MTGPFYVSVTRWRSDARTVGPVVVSVRYWRAEFRASQSDGYQALCSARGLTRRGALRRLERAMERDGQHEPLATLRAQGQL